MVPASADDVYTIHALVSCHLFFSFLLFFFFLSYFLEKEGGKGERGEGRGHNLDKKGVKKE